METPTMNPTRTCADLLHALANASEAVLECRLKLRRRRDEDDRDIPQLDELQNTLTKHERRLLALRPDERARVLFGS